MSVAVARVANCLALLILTVSLAIGTSVETPAVAAPGLVMCTPDNLAMSLLGKWTGGSTAGSVAFYLPIRITNTGPECSIGGIPRIRPVRVDAKPGVTLEALPTAVKFKDFALKNSQSVYTILGYWWTSNINSSYRKHWLMSCAPVEAIAFDITISVGRNLLKRRVKYKLPEVCTAGRANMSITPLSLALR